MAVRRVLILVGIACVCLAGREAHALDTRRSLTQFLHTAWTFRDGMPAFINTFAQTPDGYLWLGTASGLYRFDGTRLEPFYQALPKGGVATVATSASGDLWIGTSVGVSRVREGRLTNFPLPGLGRDHFVRHIAFGPKDDVWVAADKVARFDGREWKVLDSDWGSSEIYRKPGGVWGLAVARDGVVWTKNLLGLYFLRPGSTRFEKATNYAGSIIDFARDADGRLWTADVATMHFYALPDLAPSGQPPSPAQVGAPVPERVLGRVMFDRDGALWCSNGINGGLFRIRSVTASKAELEEFKPADGLTDGTPGRAFEDHEGDIWVGTDAGLNRFAPANVITDPSISIRTAGAQITASRDAVYVADGWVPPAPATVHRVQTIYAITDGAPRSLPINIGNMSVLNAHGSNGTLIASRQELLRLSDGVLTKIPLPQEATGAELMSATEYAGDLWAIFGDRGLFRRRDERWTHIVPPDIVSPFTRVRVDETGTVWLLQGENIQRLTLNRPQEGPTGSPEIGGLHAFVSDSRGVLLSGERGVSHFDGHTFHTLSRRQAPFLILVTGIVADDVGGTWFHTGAGIYRVSTSQLERAFRDPAVRVDYQRYDLRDGLRSTVILQQFGGTAARGPDGRLWFLNSDNVAWIDPHHLYRNPVPPPVSIKALTADEKSLDLATKRLDPGISKMQIDYTAISLQSPDQVKFRYRMKGVDRDWVDAGDRRQAYYAQLGPGNYRFQVIAANKDGVWNTVGASLQFEIPPTFMQSGWFVLLCAAIAAFLLWLVYSLRMRQVTAGLQRRFEERVAERERIARELHDTLLQAVQGLILKIQNASEDIPADSPSRKVLAQALDRADEVLVEGRDRVKDLRISHAVSSDLSSTIGTMGSELAQQNSVRFNVSVEGTTRALDSIVREEVLRIAQEALANAFRHANASKIEAEIIFERKEFLLRIRDDGRGIDEVTLKTGRDDHWGLQGMRERAKKIRAKFEVWSRRGAGTEIELRVPARIAYKKSPWGWRGRRTDATQTEQ